MSILSGIDNMLIELNFIEVLNKLDLLPNQEHDT